MELRVFPARLARPSLDGVGDGAGEAVGVVLGVPSCAVVAGATGTDDVAGFGAGAGAGSHAVRTHASSTTTERPTEPEHARDHTDHRTTATTPGSAMTGRNPRLEPSLVHVSPLAATPRIQPAATQRPQGLLGGWDRSRPGPRLRPGRLSCDGSGHTGVPRPIYDPSCLQNSGPM